MYRDDQERREKARRLLARVRVAAPCPADWDGMVGDARVRHCALCDKKVFELRQMTAVEAMDLLASNDSICARLYRRRDGTIITSDCEVGRKKRRRKIGLALAGAAAVTGASMMPSAPPAPMLPPVEARVPHSHEELVLEEPFELDEDTFLHGPHEPTTREPIEPSFGPARAAVFMGLVSYDPRAHRIVRDSATDQTERAPEDEPHAEQVEEPVDGIGAAVDDAAAGDLADGDQHQADQ